MVYHTQFTAWQICVRFLLSPVRPIAPDLIDALAATESERDFGICEQSAGNILYTFLSAQGQFIHDTAPHYHQEKCGRASGVSYFPRLKIQKRTPLLTETAEDTLSTHCSGLDDVACCPDSRVEEDRELVFGHGAPSVTR